MNDYITDEWFEVFHLPWGKVVKLADLHEDFHTSQHQTKLTTTVIVSLETHFRMYPTVGCCCLRNIDR